MFEYIKTEKEFYELHQQVLDGTLDEMPTPIREEYIGWKWKLGID